MAKGGLYELSKTDPDVGRLVTVYSTTIMVIHQN
jgi:hypothetical protein